MILLDANILVYAYSKRSPYHERAIQWLEEVLNGHGRVGIPWATIFTFTRLLINKSVAPSATTPAVAWSFVEAWLDNPRVWIPQPGEKHREIVGRLIAQSVGAPNDVPDAHLAALAIEHDLLFCTNDGHFTRFPGLRWKNPLQP